MRILRLQITLLASVILAAFAAVCAQERDADQPGRVSLLSVITSPQVSVIGDRLTLGAVNEIIYFSERPFRIAGELTSEGFVKQWTEAQLLADPLNAVLSRGNTGQNSVIELTSIERQGDSLSFQYRLLDGDPLPSVKEAASLFVDSKIVGINIP